MKQCCACGETKPTADFARRTASRDGLQHRCRPCANRSKADWRKANPEKARAYARKYYRRDRAANLRYARDNWRLSSYGLTPDTYEQMLAAQGGGCAICGAGEPGGKGGWHVDHDHACCPGKKTCGTCVRGLLCVACNLALGFIKDDPRIALSLARYLEQRSEG